VEGSGVKPKQTSGSMPKHHQRGIPWFCSSTRCGMTGKHPLRPTRSYGVHLPRCRARRRAGPAQTEHSTTAWKLAVVPPSVEPLLPRRALSPQSRGAPIDAIPCVGSDDDRRTSSSRDSASNPDRASLCRRDHPSGSVTAWPSVSSSFPWCAHG
jgi:hypothetical protein